jgi:hypothetical protein
MPLSWNEIKHRAISFGNEWKDETREASERQSFWNDFFNVFGLKRRNVASFEEPVKKLSGSWGAIDIFWAGKLLGEHKSAGQDLDKAHAQAMGYIRGLQDTGRGKEIPRFIMVSDFRRIALHDLEPEPGAAASFVFPVTEFHKHVHHFAFILGLRQSKLDPEDPANIEAAELMAELHDALLAGGYEGHDLRVFLVRILFCLFADDTGIFPQDSFKLYLTDRTHADGSDLGSKLARLFRILNNPEDKRQANLEEELRAFPYVNGQLFAESLDFADFNTSMRDALLRAANFHWERISPAVFGSLFQGVMDSKERRQIGAHYTSEADIMKLIRSLFLDDLRAQFDRLRTLKIGRIDKLRDLQKHLASLRFFDPACGCGNFLVITYRELRRLELEILREIHGTQTEFTLDTVNQLSLIDVDQMYGIEIVEFPARIAEVALWLADHQANQELSIAFSQLYIRIPLKRSPHIHVDDALELDWQSVLPSNECSFVLGNPPFIGKHLMNDEQNAAMERLGHDLKGIGVLDFVAGWYIKSCRYIQGTKIRVAFVSTNSITQGEQPSVLWPRLFEQGIKIHFGHRTFVWESEARGKAHVHCVIIGFAAFDIETKRLFDYDRDRRNPSIESVPNISPYLVSGNDWALPSSRKPICAVPPIIYGSKPVDGGGLIVEETDRLAFEEANPGALKYVRPLMCADEYLYNIPRWCLWLQSLAPEDVRQNPGLKARLDQVREFRAKSPKLATRKKADYPSLFAEIRQPEREYILVPLHTSENRRYVPFGYFTSDHIVHNSCSCIPNATPFHFGVLSSALHMAWMNQVCGRIKSDYRYSNTLVYNNFPWPEAANEAQRATVEKAAQTVLDARAQFPDSTLADLYDPTTMPPVLAKAHADLDRAVDRCYRKEPFPHDRARVEHLFALYENLVAPLAISAKTIRQRVLGKTRGNLNT